MKEQFVYNGHEYKKGDKIRIVSTYDSRQYNDDTLDDVGAVYKIIGWLEPDDKDGVPARLVQVEAESDDNYYRDFITKYDEFEPYVETARSSLSFMFTGEQQEKLCREHGYDINKMSAEDLLDLLAEHLNNL